MPTSNIEETSTHESLTTLHSTSTKFHTTTVMAPTPTPTTLSTSVYPYPSQAKASLETSAAANRNTTKLEDQLQWYKTYHRNSAIAFSVLAVVILGFIALKLWLCIRRRKKAAIDRATGGERKWFGQKAVRKVAQQMI